MMRHAFPISVSRIGIVRAFGAMSACLLLYCSSQVFAAPAGWNQTWGDEFDGTTVNASKWDRIYWLTPHNNERQAYDPNHVTVSGGNLVLTADDVFWNVPGNSKPYTSGKVESKYVQQYGRWEIRAKLPGTLGTWPAIWLLPDTNQYSWPSQGEIDILENRGNQPHLTSSAFHWGPDFFGRQFTYDEQEAANGGQDENYHEDFHIYAVEWDATKLRFFVDDVHYHTITNAETANSFYPNGFLTQQTAPMELNINVAVGGDFVGGAQPDGNSVWPQQMLVDYVRVYERDASPPPVVFRNGSFEEQGGSLAGWGVFGNSIPNVQTHNEAPALDGSETLKLFGQFNSSLNYSGIEQGISVSPGDSISASASAFIRAADDLVGDNAAFMKFDYYSDFGGEFGTSEYLGESPVVQIGNAATLNDVWLPHSLTDTAPADAVEARLVFLFVQDSNEGGAIHIDGVTFTNLDLQLDPDANGDGDVDGGDFLAWQAGVGLNDGTSVADGDFNYDGTVDSEDLQVWQQSAQSLASSEAVQIPEPSSLALVSLWSLYCLTNSRSRKVNRRSQLVLTLV